MYKRQEQAARGKGKGKKGEDREAGSRICTEYEPIDYRDGYTLLKVTLITGKTHQIRAHLASVGYPIVGDYKYGDFRVNEEARKKYKVTSQMLHSFCMVFPEMSEPLAHLSEKSFEAPLPGEFKRMFGEVILGI